MKCPFCKKGFERLGRHTPVCGENPSRESGYFRPKKKPCGFCGREFSFLGSHTKYCKSNPDREEYVAHPNLHTTGRKHSKKTKRLLSEIFKRKVLEDPGKFSGFNRWKHRSEEYDGHVYHSSWEVKVAKYFEHSKIRFQPNQDSFEYSWKGERRYTPDFYLPRYRVYVEVKGRETPRDRAKWRDFPGRLLVVKYIFIRTLNSGVRIEMKSFLRRFAEVKRQVVSLDDILRDK